MQINVIEYLEQGALVRCPEKTAVVDGDTSYTFAQLAAHAKRCATHILARLDVFRSPIAVFLPRGAETILADLGIMYSGNIYTNLDVKSPIQRTRAILENIAPALIITSQDCRAALDELGVSPETILVIEDALTDAVCGDEPGLMARLGRVIDTDPLCIINTSGSTGVPKSVVMHHRSVVDFMDWVMGTLGLEGNATIGSLSPFCFDIYTLELFYSLAKGATLAIIPDQIAAFPQRLAEFLAAQQVSFIFWVPTIMVNMANQDILSAVELGCLTKVLFAGEVFPTKHFNYWRRHLPNAQFVNLYGPIEITVDCTYYPVEREFGDDEPLPIGFPCRNTDILILGDDNQPAAIGERGELCVRGSSLALGYWNNPERTAAAFTQNPLNKRYPELIYRTGDLAYWNEHGEIMFLGRKDFQIKHLGYRIELGEVEHAVVSSGLVRNACVLYNSAQKEITLIFEAEQEVSPGTFRQGLSDRLPKYMLPTRFHQMEALPRNPNGKIDRNKLASMFTGGDA